MSPRNWAVAIALCGLGTAGAAYATGNVVRQKGKIFAPDELTQAVGSMLRIENDDTIPHNVMVTAPNGENRNMGMQKPGDHADIALEKLGEYQVRCGIHPKMKLVIQVR